MIERGPTPPEETSHDAALERALSWRRVKTPAERVLSRQPQRMGGPAIQRRGVLIFRNGRLDRACLTLTGARILAWRLARQERRK